MPLKTSYFNVGIFKNNIRRFWLITFSYTLFMLLFIVGHLNSEIARMNRATNFEILSNVGKNIFGSGNDIIVLFLGFYPLAAALAVFSYMHFTKNAAMIHSLPVSRETLFVTNYLSGLFIVTFPLLFNGLILIITELLAGFPNLVYALIWIGLNLTLTFLLYSFAVFAGMFTGHMAAQAIFFYIFNFLALFLEAVIESILRNFLFGFVSNTQATSFEAWSPLYNLRVFFTGFRNDLGSVATLVGYLIAGTIFLLLGFLLYKKRHMEVATDVISFSFVKPIFKYGVAFCSSGLLGIIIVEVFNIRQNLAAYIIAYLIGGLIGYFSAEMLIRKTFRVFRAYKGYIVFAVILALLLASISFDLYGYERRVPEDSEVELIGISPYMDSTMRIALRPEDYDPEKHRYITGYLENPPMYLNDEHIRDLRESMQGITENRKVITKARQIHDYIVKNENLFKENENLRRKDTQSQDSDFFQNRNLYFIYRLKDGSLVERQYSLLTYKDNTELDKLLRDYFSIPGVRESYEPILVKAAEDIRSISVYFTTKDGHYHDFMITENVQDLLDVYKKDILARDPLELMYRTSEPWDYNIDLNIEFKQELINRNKRFGSRLDGNFENTINYLVKRGVFTLEDLRPSDPMLKKEPTAVAVPATN